MHRMLGVAFAIACASAVACASALVSPAQATDEPIALRGMGSFHVGGRVVEVSGKPVREVAFTPGGVPAKVDSNGKYQVEQMYVQYFLPQNRKGKVPLLMWHGGGLTGVTYETTPDGREGWLNMFIRKGWDVYNSDAVERGRSGFASSDIFQGEPVFLNQGNAYERFRIGGGEGTWDSDPAKRKVLPGNQFPVQAYENFVKQIVPRWTTTDAAIIAAYTELVDRICPCVILFHSQAGQFGFKVAQARPDKVKALVAVEPAGIGDTAKAAVLKDVPTVMIFGDYILKDARWPKIRQNDYDFADAIRAGGGKVDVINLPEIGIKGNSHMMMMDKNNGEIADVIEKWLTEKGLVD
jgi:hypothetical protein